MLLLPTEATKKKLMLLSLKSNQWEEMLQHFSLIQKILKALMLFVKNVTDHLQQNTGSTHIDYLINNAGTALYIPDYGSNGRTIRRWVDIHFKGVFFLTQKLLPFINDGGGIINVSSGLARFANTGSSVYGSIKAGVEMLTKYMAKELGSRKN